MNVLDFSRAGVLMACGFVLGRLFSQSIINYRGSTKYQGSTFLSDGRQPIQPSIKPAEMITNIQSQSTNQQKNNSKNLENSSNKIGFLYFSKIKKQMR